AHPGLGRLPGQGVVGEDRDEDLPATLDVPGHRDPGRLDLPVGDVRRLQRLDPVVPEGPPVAALAAAGPARPARLPEARGWFAWHQPGPAIRSPAPVGAAGAGRRLPVGRAGVATGLGRGALRGGAADLRPTGGGPGGAGAPRAPGAAGTVAVPATSGR